MSCFEERDLARRVRAARAWLARDERARMIGLVVLSLAISIAMSLTVTAIVGFVSRRRVAAPTCALQPGVGVPSADAMAVPAETAGVPFTGAEVSGDEDRQAQAAGA